MKTHHRRGKWTGRPDAPPSCPGCGGSLVLSQPDRSKSDELLGSCDGRACQEWSVWIRREGRWMVVRRISAEERRNPVWTPARPSTPTTASR